MGIKRTYKDGDIRAYLRQRLALLGQAVVYRMILVGEQFIVNCRTNGTYKDQTGNLRASPGYAVYKDGRRMADSFASQGEGKAKADAVIRELKSEHRKGYVLIGVVGMEYAAAVEAKGYDVISNSAQQAAIDLRNAFEAIRKNFERG